MMDVEFFHTVKGLGEFFEGFPETLRLVISESFSVESNGSRDIALRLG